jgi:hypothetical protein
LPQLNSSGQPGCARDDTLLSMTCYPSGKSPGSRAVAPAPQRPHGHTDWVRALTAAPDGWLASAGWDDTVRVWDPAAGTATHILTGHIGTVQALTVAGDGSWLASGGHDKTVRIWNLIRSDVESLKPAGHSAGGSHATSASRSMKAAHTRSGEAAITREAVSVRALGGIVMTGSAAPPVIQLCVPIADPTAEAAQSDQLPSRVVMTGTVASGLANVRGGDRSPQGTSSTGRTDWLVAAISARQAVVRAEHGCSRRIRDTRAALL